MNMTTLPSVSMIGLVDSEQFKHLLAELANGGNNPKHRRALVREVREAVKACAEAQRQACAAELHGMRWIPTDEALPAPYEEVRILLDGVPRIARLNHASTYFQLATFLDNTKAQYVASFDRVAGWMPLPMQAPAVASTDQAKREPAPRMVDRKCKWCKDPFQARAADVARGWGLFCSKSCKAMKQEKRTGQYRALQDGGHLSEDERRERDHQQALYESTSCHGQDPGENPFQ